jgi:hypothetical protein
MQLFLHEPIFEGSPARRLIAVLTLTRGILLQKRLIGLLAYLGQDVRVVGHAGIGDDETESDDATFQSRPDARDRHDRSAVADAELQQSRRELEVVHTLRRHQDDSRDETHADVPGCPTVREVLRAADDAARDFLGVENILHFFHLFPRKNWSSLRTGSARNRNPAARQLYAARRRTCPGLPWP